MVAHGHDNTLPISLDLMLQHCRAVVRGAQRPLIVGDLPFGSYESSPAQAVESAVRIIKEGGVDAVKLEGGCGGSAGFAGGRLLRCVPAPVAATATAALQIPTIGIGAGPFCSGQVLVYHDLLGMFQSKNHSKVTPKFCKQFANIGAVINEALTEYRQEVEARSFPGPTYTPYKIPSADVEVFANALQTTGLNKAADAAINATGNEKKLVVLHRRAEEINKSSNGNLSAEVAA
ncbi:hypothetical protein EJB05_32688, partial [Eragrostis curvula]